MLQGGSDPPERSGAPGVGAVSATTRGARPPPPVLTVRGSAGQPRRGPRRLQRPEPPGLRGASRRRGGARRSGAARSGAALRRPPAAARRHGSAEHPGTCPRVERRAAPSRPWGATATRGRARLSPAEPGHGAPLQTRGARQLLALAEQVSSNQLQRCPGERRDRGTGHD